MKTSLGIYVHIPFCQSKCLYCDFLSFTGSNDLIDSYIKSLVEEIENLSVDFKNYQVNSIYIGGGTPSHINSSYIDYIMENIYKYFHVSRDSENTIEVNPNSIDFKKALIYRKSAINRLSLGIQSFNDKELKAIARAHNSQDAYRPIRDIKKAGIDNISLDLIMGLPFQSLESFEYSLKEALKLGIKHLSVYDLILEESSYLYKKMLKGEDLKLPSEESNIKMFENLKKISKSFNFHQYEISNYALDGYESRHNKKYWKGLAYLGLGLGSSSKVDNLRWKNTSNIYTYIEKVSKIEKKEVLSPIDQINELIFMGLRLNEGIAIDYLEDKFKIDFAISYKDQIKKNLDLEFINLDDGYFKLTEKGRMFANQVELDFFRVEDE